MVELATASGRSAKEETGAEEASACVSDTAAQVNKPHGHVSPR